MTVPTFSGVVRPTLLAYMRTMIEEMDDNRKDRVVNYKPPRYEGGAWDAGRRRRYKSITTIHANDHLAMMETYNYVRREFIRSEKDRLGV